ncbi:Rrf2 family transcriptional regulator [Bizionia argentinensis JUB59]|uniref:Rrf2 family transcriptional regulator n=1 Tax=Bizionia argentinensis JUB59 TaxID=1046627 RepID=G2E9G7_9FLAO|nr:Rrf2 family transcriptional regulator [Bizionia argentinensis]EGV45050.1 Rrf2 family transcriptional regulator [Bizionia argentinensis JUB59]
MFSKSCEYGLRAVIFIAQQSRLGKKVSLITISEAIDSPQAFTAKILQQLTKNQIVNSAKGPKGGFYIETENMQLLNLSAIVKVLDGDSIYTGCGLGLKQCNDQKPCPLHYRFVAIREELKNMLEKTTLLMLVNDMDLDIFHLKT